MGTRVAIACQGGGSHTAFTAGALKCLLTEAADEYEVVGLSGTSGGAVCATAAWYGLLSDEHTPQGLLDDIWADLTADSVADRFVNDWVVMSSAVETSGFPTARISPYQNPMARAGQRQFQRLLERHIDFDRLPDLATDDAPRLAVGTVNVTAGEFETFCDDEVTARAILASSAIPDLYPAVEIHGHTHWDGLFSHNPPIRDLFHLPAERKPEELWIVQINPQRIEEEPRSLREIYDRRNELSGNISLNEQLHFIEKVNTWIDEGHLPESDFQKTEIHRISIDEQFFASSKLDRSPDFIAELERRGHEKAKAFCEQRRES
ncbi:patatin-like phospholipase family protein [Haloarchaeobius amylolyticus]|uniref:patatin-like phospholipase family protein n=1 Tax=Haloarchaeobius amylolyticus TaxID=1198296 RepID=UPI0022710FE0|nr:patatin-like phospholipase family protein [Haloarchaeobius amylolyticus]